MIQTLWGGEDSKTALYHKKTLRFVNVFGLEMFSHALLMTAFGQTVPIDYIQNFTPQHRRDFNSKKRNSILWKQSPEDTGSYSAGQILRLAECLRDRLKQRGYQKEAIEDQLGLVRRSISEKNSDIRHMTDVRFQEVQILDSRTLSGSVDGR
ncbi:hypothetical protein DPEC_G00318370 [Dallia pectoralis]|uniref:Uncharacterized protein n=1 Tax=Dallia pectoralis TaxID=75939 RepID=A0ACC2F9H7_DALPE|nr:hypothetical protein DPEC_G00318370 [Dallia pectoralis]